MHWLPNPGILLQLTGDEGFYQLKCKTNLVVDLSCTACVFLAFHKHTQQLTTWADASFDLLLLKSSMPDQIISFCIDAKRF